MGIRLKIFGDQHLEVANSLIDMGDVCNAKGDYDRALEFYQRAHGIRLIALGADHPDLANSYIKLGIVNDNNGEYEKALEFYQIALEIRKIYFGENHSAISIDYFHIGKVYKSMQLFLPAIKALKLSFELDNKGGPLFQIAKCYEGLLNKPKALEYYIKSAVIRKDDPEVGIGHDATSETVITAIRLAKELHLEEALPSWFQELE